MPSQRSLRPSLKHHHKHLLRWYFEDSVQELLFRTTAPLAHKPRSSSALKRRKGSQMKASGSWVMGGPNTCHTWLAQEWWFDLLPRYDQSCLHPKGATRSSDSEKSYHYCLTRNEYNDRKSTVRLPCTSVPLQHTLILLHVYYEPPMQWNYVYVSFLLYARNANIVQHG